MDNSSFTVAKIFGDHMVLQRNKPIKLWGTSQKVQTLRVSINNQVVASCQAPVGPWRVTLPAMEASRNLTLQICAENEAESLSFQDVAVGEVWIAGGQSNMEFPLKYDAEACRVIPQANNPEICFYDCPKIKFEGQDQEDDFSQAGFWRPLNPTNAPHYSAVGFYFASKIYEQTQVPVGIVGCNWGGTTASAWLDEGFLAADERLSIYLQEYQAATQSVEMDQYIAAEERSRKVLKQPVVVKLISSIMKKTPGPLLYPLYTALLTSSAKSMLSIGPRSENRPGGLYHTMVQKIAGFSARGVIWYQGESDDLKAERYGRLFSAVIRCWREAWEDDLPFLFVQLAPFEKWMGVLAVNYPILREQQEWVSKTVPGAYMISIMDAGSRLDIHPKNKRPVGERLARLAVGKVFGEEILCEAPEVLDIRLEDDSLVILFSHVGEGLQLKGPQLKSLEILTQGKAIMPFKVKVTQDSLVIQAANLSSARELEVRLAYQNYAEVNLYNSAGMPAKPFRWTIPAGPQEKSI